MKITSVEPLLVDRFLLVRIRTECGLEGVGESGAWGHLEASATAIRKFGDYLIGRDPQQIEHHWNVMHRAHHFTGTAISGAISAIDIALWDIKGKHFGVPVWQLLGGKIRDTARLYGHVKGRTIGNLVEESVRLKEQGFTALGRLNPLMDEDEEEPYYRAHAFKMEEAIDNVRRLREAVGVHVDLCIEIHRRMTPPEAVTLARGIEQYNPMFYEDPLRPNSGDAMSWVQDHIPIPIATGERFTNIYQFQALLTRHAVQFLRPCVCVVGGITATKKIAAMAEAHDCQVVPHNPLSPLSLAACLQVDACVPNFAIQEYPCGSPGLDGREGLAGAEMMTGLAEPEAGFIRIPDAPGIGITLAPDIERRFPPKVRPIAMRPHRDGSMVDQ